MKYLVWLLVLILLVLHQDYWQWNVDWLVFGFLPYTLLYHVVLSLVAAGVWVLAINFAWPTHLEQEDDQPPAGGSQA